MKHLGRLGALILFSALLIFSTPQAQNPSFENDLFTVQLPASWEDTSTSDTARATDSQTGAVFYALTASSVQDALLRVDMVFTDAIETINITLPSGEWTQSTYIEADTVTLVWSQVFESQTHVMIASAPLSAAADLVPVIQATIASYAIRGEPVNLPNSESIVYPRPEGIYGVGRVEYLWVDSERDETYTENDDDQRAIAVTVWYPAEPANAAPITPWLSMDMAVAYAQLTGTPVERLNHVRVYAIPDAEIAASDAKFPILMMSHGDGLMPALYTSYAEALASHGYVVFGVSHPHNAAVIAYPDGTLVYPKPEASAQAANLTPDMTPLEIAQALDEQGQAVVRVHAADMRFVLDQIEQLNGSDPRFSNRLDLEHVGVFGHSLGGATAIETLLQDTRIDAAVNLDGTVFSVVDGGSERPTMTLAVGFVDTSAITDAELEAMQLSREAFEQIITVTTRAQTLFSASPEAYFVVIDGTHHLSFSDAGLLSPVSPNLSFEAEIEYEYALQITGAYLTAFFDHTLRDRPFNTASLTQTYPESRFID